MKRIHPRIAGLQLLFVLALAAPVVALGTYVASKHQWAQGRLDDLGPRYARLSGLVASKDQIDNILKDLQASVALHSYAAGMDATKAANDAQQRIRGVFESSQLSIVAVQVIEAKEEGDFERIRVTIQVEGSMGAIQEAMLKLNEQKPTVFIDAFTIQSQGYVPAGIPPRLSGNFEFSVLRAKT